MLAESALQSHVENIRNDGYTVIEAAASADLVAGLKDAVERIEREHQLGPARTSGQTRR